MRPISSEEVYELAAQIQRHQVASVAICLLYSFIQPLHEERIRDILLEALPGIPIMCSCSILPERREYERTSTTVVSAYLAPTITRYIEHMVTEVQKLGVKHQMYIMQSNGGLNTPQTATANPGTLLLSGPAAGVVAATRVGVEAGFRNLISADMGGTSFDVALIKDGQCLLSAENRIEESIFNVSMLDINTIGAGGGSIGWLDSAKKLHVGPQSAGARPGPACYGQGGNAPTVTDVNLLLGFLNFDGFLGGAMRLKLPLAERAIREQVAVPLGLSLHEAAAGMYRIVNTNMASATSLVSVEMGYDPRDFVLLAFGGAGPLHAVAIAQELDIPCVVVPRYPGITSAAGLVVANIEHNFVQTSAMEFDAGSEQILIDGLEALRQRADRTLEADDVPLSQRRYEYSVDVKYVGQGYALNIPLSNVETDGEALSKIAEHFHSRHQAVYGFWAGEDPIELINLRLRAIGVLEEPSRQPQSASPGDPRDAYRGEREAWAEATGDMVQHKIYDRDSLAAGHVLGGPAIIEQSDSTTVIPPGWQGIVDHYGNLVLRAKEQSSHG